MSKTFLGFMEKAQKYTITEALYFIGDTYFIKENTRKPTPRSPLEPIRGRSKIACLNKGKKCMFD